MRKVSILLVLVALLVVGDITARSVAEGKVVAAIESSSKGAVGAEAEITGFPFVPSLLAAGNVRRIQVRIDELRQEKLSFTNVVVDLEGVVLDRDLLLSGKAEVRDIDRGTVALDLHAGALGRLLGEVVTIANGEVSVTVRGRTVKAGLRVVDGPALEIDPENIGGPPIRIALPVGTVMPCEPNVLFMQEHVRLSCTFTDVPPALLKAVSQGARA